MDPQQALLTLERSLPHLHLEVDALLKAAGRATAHTGQPTVLAIDRDPELVALRDRILQRLRTIAHIINGARARHAVALKRSRVHIRGPQPVAQFERALKTLETRLDRVKQKLLAGVDDIAPGAPKGIHGVTLKSWQQTFDGYAKQFVEVPDSPRSGADAVFIAGHSGPVNTADPGMLIALLYSLINLLIERAKGRR